MNDPSLHRKKGNDGEQMAEFFLQKKGYKTFARNYCVPGGEIDLIMWDVQKQETVFIEVKTRYSHSAFGDVQESISSQKLAFMQRAMERFFASRGRNFYQEKFRIDAVFIQMDTPVELQVTHKENAFNFDDFFDTMW
jgi:putative endonuclease